MNPTQPATELAARELAELIGPITTSVDRIKIIEEFLSRRASFEPVADQLAEALARLEEGYCAVRHSQGYTEEAINKFGRLIAARSALAAYKEAKNK